MSDCSRRCATCFAQVPEARVRGYQAGAVLVQRQGRSVRSMRGRRHLEDRDAVPAGRVRAVRGVPRQALQPRDARDQVQGPLHRRRARDDSRRGAGVLRDIPNIAVKLACCARLGWATSGSASPPRRSRAARRSGSSSRASWRGGPPAVPSTSWTSRPPACTLPTSQQLLGVLGRLVEAGNTVVVIEHNLDVIKTRRLDHRPGPRRRRRGRRHGGRGTPEQVAKVEASYTGRYLRRVLGVKEFQPARRSRARDAVPA